MSDQVADERENEVLHVGIILTGTSGHRVDARYMERGGLDANNSIYGDEPVRVEEYDDDELLASLSYVLADAVARRCFPATGQPAETPALLERYVKLITRVLVLVDRLPVPT